MEEDKGYVLIGFAFAMAAGFIMGVIITLLFVS